ncbi:MAG: SLBB domain-containing protein [Desulfobacteraceae bacterium]
MSNKVQEAKKRIGSSSIGALGTGAGNIAYIKSLSESKKKELIGSLSTEELLEIFVRLESADKQDLFILLSNTQKRDLFQVLTDTDKQKIFQTLDDNAKIDLFNMISDQDRMIILSNLGRVEKSRFVNSLSPSEKKDWLEMHPELISEVDILDEGFDEGEFYEEDEEEEPSRLEKFFSGKMPTEIDKELHQFGYDFFSQKSSFGQKSSFFQDSSFAPENNVPVGPEYVIGPDDSFTINLWGKVEEEHRVTVSRDGTINLARLGTLSVGGLTFSELKKFLDNKYKEYYPDFEMSITMGDIKNVDVYMVGELNRPNTYSLNSLSTVISALSAAGGPSKNGSLRNIEIRSNEKLIKTIDLYDFFINGLRENDITLKQGYTVFVPVIGPTAAVSGQVKRPAIYEMKDEQTLDEIIDLAGGVLPTSHLQNVIIERIIGHKRRVVASFDLDPSNENTVSNLKTAIKDGDLIKIYPIHKEIEKIVYLEGNVKYPNEYELREGMKIRDIIPSYDYLLPEPYLSQAEITRLVPPDLHPEIRPFDLGAMLDGDESQNLALQDRDRIKIYNKWEKQNIPEVSIRGAVRNGGIFTLYEGMTVKDLIFAAGNTTRNAYLTKGELSRIVRSESGTDIIKINFSPEKAIKGNPEDNLVLQVDDQIHIREIPRYNASLERKVYLDGEFKFPGEYPFSEGERISSVIERAGGFTEEAYPYGAVFTRESNKEIWAARKQEYIDKLEQDILAISAFSAETALDASQASIALQTLNAKKELLEKIRQAEPTGRMLIDIKDIMLMPSGKNDLELRPGDRLVVGRRPDSVLVIGEVYNPNAIIHTPGDDVGYYLNMVGGMTSNADKRQMYIVRADGTVVSKKQTKFKIFSWDSSKRRWGFGSFKSTELNPGDTIIVPKKVVKLSWLRIVKDTTSVLYQLAVSIGVLDDILND